MGRKKHSNDRTLGKGELSRLVASIEEGDGQRWSETGKATHKGLSPDKRKGDGRTKHKKTVWWF